MDLKKLEDIFIELKQPAYKMSQVVDSYFQKPVTKWSEVKGLSKDLINTLESKLPFSTVEKVHETEASDVIKFLFKILDGGELVEAVVMKHSDDRRTLCLSCQAGCPMGCYFCATGTMGLKKNLTAFEMIDMVREVNVFLAKRKEKITNVVYMGMGEPFANYLPVKESIQMLHDPKYFGIGWRKITVSTCGVAHMIARFADDFPQVNLAISLHAADNIKRSQLMPVNDRFPIQQLMKECRLYVEKTHRKLFFEYLVIENFNDLPEDVKGLRKLLDHHLYHLNLIRFHATEAVSEKYSKDWKAPSREALKSFVDQLSATGLSLTLRRSFGEKIDAACGMLAIKNQKKIKAGERVC